MRPLLLVCLVFVSSAALSKELTVMFGVSRPPFIMESPPSGITYELFQLISYRANWQFHPQFAPNKRMENELRDMQVDVIVEVQKDSSNVYYSDPFVAYRNFAVSYVEDQLAFNNYSDLRNRSVCAWQNASKNLGWEFETEIKGFRAYKEFSFQKKQVRYWLAKQCEVIIIDDTVLKWWVKELTLEFAQRDRVVDNNIRFAPLPNNTLWWYVAFKNQKLRDQFNKELRAIRSNKEYDSIRERVRLTQD